MNNTNRMDRGMGGPVKKQDISLGLMVSISNTLVGLVQNLLGPGGQQTLLSTSTGKVMLTRDGLTILSSLHLAHPVAHFIIESLRSHFSVHRDGSKTFIIYLSQILKDIAHCIGENTGQSAMSRVKLSLELSKFLTSDFQHVAKLVVDKVKVCSGKRYEEDCVSVVKGMLKGSLQTCLQRHMVLFFTEYLAAFLSLENPGKGNLQCQLEHVLQHFDMYHSKVTTQPLQKSKICEGILLEVDLQAVCQGKTEDGAIVSKRFALMDVNFESENERGGNDVSFRLTPEKVENYFSQKRTSLENTLKSLKSADVHILLCSETVPHFMQGLCKGHGLSVQCLPHEKLVFLSELTGTPVLTDLNEAVLTNCFFEARISSFVQMGRRRCTLININSIRFLQMKHLVICSPTEGACDQLCQSLFKTLKAVRECCMPSFWADSGGLRLKDVDSIGGKLQRTTRHENASLVQSFADSAVIVNCGGAFEAVFVCAISDYFASQSCRPAEQIDLLIQKMLLSVPQTLHANLCSGTFREQRQFTKKWTHMLSMSSRDQLLGFGDHGAAVTNVDCTEPVASKLAVVASVLQLVIQLLRLEAVVPVTKSLLSCAAAKELSDDEREHDEYGKCA